MIILSILTHYNVADIFTRSKPLLSTPQTIKTVNAMVTLKSNPEPLYSKDSQHNLANTIKDSVDKTKKSLTPAAQRALQEAEQRRTEFDSKNKQVQKEINGRGGLDPVRYKDWEVKGIATDF